MSLVTFGLMGVVLLIAGCTFKPLLVTEAVSQPVDKPAVTAAAIEVLQTNGYTVTLANEQTGTVTTEWVEVSGLRETLLWGGSALRKRVMVSVAPDARGINVQLTFQGRSGDGDEWRNYKLTGKEKKEASEIMQAIVQSVSTVSPRSEQTVTKPAP